MTTSLTKRALAILPFFVLMIGCGSPGEKTVPVKGKLTANGTDFSPKNAQKKPLPPGEPGVRIIFARADGPRVGEEFGCNVDSATGTFEALGTAGPGIPVGKYTVTVYLGAFGEVDDTKTKKGGGPPPIGGAPKLADTSHMSYGKVIAKLDLEIPETGKTDLAIEVDEKKAK